MGKCKSEGLEFGEQCDFPVSCPVHGTDRNAPPLSASPTPPERIQEIRERVEKATPGRWHHELGEVYDDERLGMLVATVPWVDGDDTEQTIFDRWADRLRSLVPAPEKE